MDLKLEIKNFLSIKEAKIKTNGNNITILLAPNRAGKTQLMFLLYSIFWSWWKVSKENHFFDNYKETIIKDLYSEFKKSKDLGSQLKNKKCILSKEDR